MREAEPIVVQLEDARVEGFGQTPVGHVAECVADEPGGRLGERGRHRRDLERVGAEPVEALAQELVEARRDRQRLAGAVAKPRRSSASASSRAKNGLPPDVSQTRMSVGRGSPAPRRSRSSSCSAPMLSPSISSVASRSASSRAEPTRQLAADGE